MTSMNGGEAGDGPVPQSAVPTIVRAGCSVLMAVGVLSTVLATGPLFSPGSTRCSISRSWIEDANDDKKTYNDVDTKGVEPDDLECDEALRLADQIRVKEEDPSRTVSVPSEGAVRVQGGSVAVVGLGSASAGLVTLRTLNRRARTIALTFAVLGVLFQVLGILSMAALAFVLYAIGFGAAAKSVWPRPTRGRPDPDPDPDDS